MAELQPTKGTDMSFCVGQSCLKVASVWRANSHVACWLWNVTNIKLRHVGNVMFDLVAGLQAHKNSCHYYACNWPSYTMWQHQQHWWLHSHIHTYIHNAIKLSGLYTYRDICNFLIIDSWISLVLTNEWHRTNFKKMYSEAIKNWFRSESGFDLKRFSLSHLKINSKLTLK